MPSGAEGRAGNEQRFREANERQRAAAAALVEDDEQLVPFLCECPDLRCLSVVLLALREYEDVRARPTDALAAPGHEDTTIEDVVETNARYVRTRKLGVAGEAFADLDARS